MLSIYEKIYSNIYVSTSVHVFHLQHLNIPKNDYVLAAKLVPLLNSFRQIYSPTEDYVLAQHARYNYKQLPRFLFTEDDKIEDLIKRIKGLPLRPYLVGTNLTTQELTAKYKELGLDVEGTPQTLTEIWSTASNLLTFLEKMKTP